MNERLNVNECLYVTLLIHILKTKDKESKHLLFIQ